MSPLRKIKVLLDENTTKKKLCFESIDDHEKT